MMRLRFRLPLRTRLIVLGAIALVLTYIYWKVIAFLLKDPSPDTAKTFWQWMVGIQFLLICLITPSVAANAITQEKEQQTWDMLLFTRLTPSEIILGKLTARMALIVFLLVLFLPVNLFNWLHMG